MLLSQATPMASFLDVENNLYYRLITCVYIFSVTALNIHNPKQAEINSTQKRQRDHANILIVHLHLHRPFPELTFLDHVSPLLTLIMSERRKK